MIMQKPKIVLAVGKLDFLKEESELFQGFEYTLDGILPQELAPTHFPWEVRFHCRRYDLGISESTQVLKYYRQKIKEIVDIGRDYLTVHLGFSPKASWGEALKRLEALHQFARKFGVTLCLENMKDGWTSDPVLLRKILDTTGVRLTLDLGHLNSSAKVRGGQFKPTDFIKTFEGDIVGVHVYEREEGRHLAPINLGLLRPSLEALLKTSCNWWVVELDELEEIRQTCKLLNHFLQSFTSF